MDDGRAFAATAIVAGVFDAFGNARAAAEDLLSSGFAPQGVRITSNPENPDGTAGCVAAELAAMPRLWKRLLANLIAAGGERGCRDRDRVRCGGVVVSVPVAAEAERVLARNILRLHRGFDVEYVGPGASLY